MFFIKTSSVIPHWMLFNKTSKKKYRSTQICSSAFSKHRQIWNQFSFENIFFSFEYYNWLWAAQSEKKCLLDEIFSQIYRIKKISLRLVSFCFWKKKIQSKHPTTENHHYHQNHTMHNSAPRLPLHIYLTLIK